MKLKSRGLGRKELVMDFREYTVARDGNEIVITGTIREPVHWDFSIRMCEDDLAGVTRVALQRPTLGLILRAMFKRNKDAHWSVDRKEHLEQARAAREELLEREAAKAGDETAKPRGRSSASNGSSSDDADSGDDGTPGLSRREQRKQHRLARREAKAASADQDEAAAAETSGAHRHDEPAGPTETTSDADVVDADSNA
ncbi:MAG: hypothetical protein JJLCMIEE_03258 [Acidimicrobiales bacterium]|nr:MAG: hypothetical protein EDR02_00140 [Actinomycetota bacterium]MBV6510138.1 hypothetical protein [Acidimicrobiales bacterium]RIK03798.1 MAG: hypothetical protein DCC48_15425 [Acidobacteriota bacterium]